MAFWDKEKEIAIIPKNKKEKVRILVGSREGIKFLDIRLIKFFVKEGDQEATWNPSTYGAAIPLHSLGEWGSLREKIDNAVFEMFQEDGDNVKEEV